MHLEELSNLIVNSSLIDIVLGYPIEIDVYIIIFEGKDPFLKFGLIEIDVSIIIFEGKNPFLKCGLY